MNCGWWPRPAAGWWRSWWPWIAQPGLPADAGRRSRSAASDCTAQMPSGSAASLGGRGERARRWDLMPAEPIDDLAAELLANRNLLAALAGPSIALTVDVEGGALPVRLTGEDLTRILVNLVKNAAEAMPEGGRIQLGLREFHAGGRQLPPWLTLTDRRQRAGHSQRGAGEDLRLRLHHPCQRVAHRGDERLAGLPSRAGPVHHPLHRRSCRRQHSCHQPGPGRSPLRDRSSIRLPLRHVSGPGRTPGPWRGERSVARRSVRSNTKTRRRDEGSAAGRRIRGRAKDARQEDGPAEACGRNPGKRPDKTRITQLRVRRLQCSKQL